MALIEAPARNTPHYTGRGDGGSTGRLGTSVRISKDSALIEAVGTVDEAVSSIGMARAVCTSQGTRDSLLVVQQHLSRMLAHLSATPEARAQYPGLSSDAVDWLEARIAEIEHALPPLRAFVLPGATLAGAAFHIARTTIRRAERRVVGLAETEPGLGQHGLAYLNRLSSLLFVAAVAEDLAENEAHSVDP